MSKPKPTFSVATSDFRTALTTAKAFASTDFDTIPWLATVRLRTHDDGIEIAATDRYTLSWETIKCSGEVFTVLIPLPIVRRLLDLMPGGPLVEGMTTFTALKTGRVRIDVGGDHDASLTFQPETGKFPDLAEMTERAAKAMETGEPPHEAYLDARFMARACRALADRRMTEPLKFTFTSTRTPALITAGGVTVAVMPARVNPEATR